MLSGPVDDPKERLFPNGPKGFSTPSDEKGPEVQKGSKRTWDGPKGVRAKDSLGPRFKDKHASNSLGHNHCSQEPPKVVKWSRSSRIQLKSYEGRLERFSREMFDDKRSSRAHSYQRSPLGALKAQTPPLLAVEPRLAPQGFFFFFFVTGTKTTSFWSFIYIYIYIYIYFFLNRPKQCCFG